MFLLAQIYMYQYCNDVKKAGNFILFKQCHEENNDYGWYGGAATETEREEGKGTQF